MDLASIKKFFASLTLQKLVPVILIVVIGLLLVKLLLKLFDRVLERSRLERTMFSFLRAAMRALLYTILVLVAASSLGVDVTSLVAILSVVSLAISLAVQNALSNVVGSVTLLTTHPFHVGIHCGLPEELRQLRIPLPVLVARHIERNDALFGKGTQSLKDRRACLRKLVFHINRCSFR